MGVWQMCHYAAVVVQILFATRTLGLSEHAVGLCYMGMGLGTIVGSVLGPAHQPAHRARALPGGGLRHHRRRLAAAGRWRRPTAWGVAAFALMLMLFTTGAVFIFINFLALRQAVTPEPLLGRMTSTMRWLTLLAAGPGALLGGWLGEHVGLRATLGFAAGVSLLLVLVAWRCR
jgi:predicted MFS family arabinose efflux permease